MLIDQLVAQARDPEPTTARSTATPRVYTGFERSELGLGQASASEAEQTASGIVIGPPLVAGAARHAVVDVVEPIGREPQAIDSPVAEPASRRFLARIGPPLVPREAPAEAAVSRALDAAPVEPTPDPAPPRLAGSRGGASDIEGAATRPSASVRRERAVEPGAPARSAEPPARQARAEPPQAPARGPQLGEREIRAPSVEPVSRASEGDEHAPHDAELARSPVPRFEDARPAFASAPLPVLDEHGTPNSPATPAHDDRASPGGVARTVGLPTRERLDPARARAGDPPVLAPRMPDHGAPSLEHRSDEQPPQPEVHRDASEPTPRLRERPVSPRAIEVPQHERPAIPRTTEVPQPERHAARQRSTAEAERRDDQRPELPTAPARGAQAHADDTAEPAASRAPAQRASDEPAAESPARARVAEPDVDAPPSVPETLAQPRVAVDPSLPRVASEPPLPRPRVVQVHVGRVVVRAPAPAVRPEPRPSPTPRMSLRDYLGRRNGGGR